jgi:2-desacetyl-2-hydroxyethyl bacteriochlorophyllide A dehydrogenase
MMRRVIAFTGVRQVEMHEEDIRPPGQRELLVRNEVSAISAGTERACLLDLPNLADAKPGQFPKYLGYSGVGTVVATGSAVTTFAVGDRVLTHWGSAHANYNLISDEHALRIDSATVTSEHAVFAVIAGFSLNAIRKTRFEIGESAAVVGVGILGAFALALLRCAGAAPLIAADLSPKRRELARTLGAHHAFDPAVAGYADQVRAVTRGGVHVVIEVTGQAVALKQALGFTAHFGRLALLGCTRVSDTAIDFYQDVHRPGVEILGAHTNARATHESRPHAWTWQDDARALIALMDDRRLPMDQICSASFAPNDAPAVYARLLDDPDFPVGAVFDWRT